MQYLENDMDELFRKAAENYPLKTEAQDWDDIAPALIKAPVLNASRNTGKRKYSWLFLLFFLFIATTVSILFFNSNSDLSDTKTATGNWMKKVGGGKDNNPHSSQKENFASTDVVGETNHLEQKKNPVPQNTTLLRSQSVKNKISEPLLALLLTEVTNPSTRKSSDAKEYKEYNNRKNVSIPSGTEMLDSHNRQSNNATLTVEPIKDKKENNVVGKDSSQRLLLPIISEEKGVIKKRGFYFGMVAGPQLNQVKSQGFNKTGFSAGILTGYRFNEKVSVETGVFYSKKYYYSEGKYFDMVKASPSMPSGMEVLNLKGKSAVFEIPVKLKYDFLKKAKSNVFSTAGISSYLLTKESNDYLTLVNGNQQSMEGNYQNGTKYFAAAINLSIGYSYRIGNQTSIRVEPHVQIPLRGIGVGYMPVTSAGLHIGIIWNRK